MSSDDEEYTIPMQDQRVFGAGIKRKRVHFVPSSDRNPQPPVPSSSSNLSVAERYLSLVLPSSQSRPQSSDIPESVSVAVRSQSNTLTGASKQSNQLESVEEAALEGICDICHLPLKSATKNPADGSRPHIHEATLPHQVSLPHSHPPSSIQRSRLGLKILEAQGFDPDARLGLGREGEGVRFPIKVKEKGDKLGVGVVVPTEITKQEVKGRVLGGREKGVKRLDAKEVRRKAERERRNGEKLREEFYGREDVARYLRG